MSLFIKNQPPADLLVQINNKVKLVKEELGPHIIGLTQKERQGRSMAEGREGVVRLLSKVALAHNESLNKKDNAQELEDKLSYDAQLENIRQSLNRLMEAVTDTQLANSMDCMTLYTRYLGSLQNDRANNSQLDIALREIDEWNKRYAGSAEKPEENPKQQPDTPKD